MNAESQLFADAPLALRMLEISPAAVAVIDRDEMTVLVNERLTELLGFSREDLIGKPANIILGGKSLCDLMARSVLPMTHNAFEHRPFEIQIQAIGKQGEVVPITVSVHRVERGQHYFFLVHLVRSDRQTVDRDLLESERLAAIAQMVSGLAHESRNAMQRAVACLDLLELDLKANPDQMRLSQRIRESLAMIFENYDEVRRYAQPICLNSQRVSLLHLCQVIFNESLLETGEVQHRLEFLMSGDQDDVVLVDREKMKLVLRHLLDNAIDATSQPAWIEARCQGTRWQEKDVVKFSFRDHGCGFDELSLRNAFQPFYTTKQHGTGLGLAICRRIIEAHHGMISAANHPGGGAVIELWMPIDKADK